MPNPFDTYVKKHFHNRGPPTYASSKFIWAKNLINSGRFDKRVLTLDKPTYLDNYLQVCPDRLMGMPRHAKESIYSDVVLYRPIDPPTAPTVTHTSIFMTT
jgi:hypothetical protein